MGGGFAAGQAARLCYACAMDHDRSARPNTLPWPPILYGGGAVLALILGRAMPLPAEWAAAPVRVLGLAMIAGGVLLDLWAMAVMWRGRANILPHRAATALVTTGPFGFSRNPIYLGNTLLLAGVGLGFGLGWFVVAALAAAGLVGRLAIAREEAHLNARFGREWRDYALRVNRWLGRSTRR
jgi:protein-S-isoprenylcysteine O-methyltransferase Ste14